MKIIAFLETDDCSAVVIIDPDQISITKCSDFYIAATKCMYTGMPVTCEISEIDAEHLIKNGVRCFDLNESDSKNEKITKKKIIE